MLECMVTYRYTDKKPYDNIRKRIQLMTYWMILMEIQEVVLSIKLQENRKN